MGERKATLHFMCPAGFIKRSAFTDITWDRKPYPTGASSI
jgi:hypothetical protein